MTYPSLRYRTLAVLQFLSHIVGQKNITRTSRFGANFLSLCVGQKLIAHSYGPAAGALSHRLVPYHPKRLPDNSSGHV